MIVNRALVFRSKEATLNGASVQTKRPAQSIAFFGAGASPAPGAMPFPGEYEHRIRLEGLREEIDVIGVITEPHGDLPGYRVPVGRGRLWSRCCSAALSFPASILIGPVFDDGVPF